MAQITVHRGTFIMFNSDVDGGDTPAIDALADTGTVVLDVEGNYLGANLIDTNGDLVSGTPPATHIVQLSQIHQTAPGRISSTIRNNQFSQTTDALGGSAASILNGSTDVLTKSGNVYLGVSGTPKTATFEDYPTIRGVVGIPPRLAFGAPKVVQKAKLTGIASRLRFGNATVFIDQFVDLTNQGIASRLRFGNPTVHPEAVHITPAGVGSAEQAGTPTIKIETYLIKPLGVNDGRVGQPSIFVQGLIAPDGVPSEEQAGTPTVVPGPFAMQVSGFLDESVVGTPSIARYIVVIGGVPTAEQAGIPSVHTGPVFITPPGVSSAERYGRPTVLATNNIVITDGVHSGEIVGVPTIILDPTHQLLRVAAFLDESATGFPKVALWQGVGPKFGRIITGYDVELAMKQLLMDWVPAFVAQMERQNSLTPELFQLPKSYQVFDDEADLSPGQLPAVIIASPGMPEEPTRDGEGMYCARWHVDVYVIASAKNDSSSRRLAHYIGGAVRTILLNKAVPIDGYISTRWLGDTHRGTSLTLAESMAGYRATVVVDVEDIMHDTLLDLLEPPSDPYVPIPANPTVATTSISVTAKEAV